MGDSTVELLAATRDGDDEALATLLARTQARLREIAARHLARECQNHTLQPTALVNEAYLKMVDQRDRGWENERHFLAIASTAMRRVLLEHARAKVADKRGGGAKRITIFEEPSVFDEPPEALIALDEALEALATVDPSGAELVEQRWFGGLAHTEIARARGVSTRTIEREWRACVAWLRDRLERDVGLGTERARDDR